MKKRRVLVIDDEKAIRETLSEILTDEGYAVTAVESGEEGLRRLKEESFDLVFLDVWLRDRDGLSILEAAGDRLREVPVIMISGHANVETAVRAVRLGAYDFPGEAARARARDPDRAEGDRAARPPGRGRLLPRPDRVGGRPDRRIAGPAAPPRGDRPSRADRRARAHHRRERHRQGARRARHPPAFGTSRCSSRRGQLRGDPRGADRVRALRPREGLLHRRLRGAPRQVRRGGRGDALPGRGRRHVPEDPGQGAPRAAGRALHAGRRDAPISSDARVLSATNKDLAEEIRRGAFREDLYFRLAVVPIEVPPLRDRREDIPPLAAHFLRLASERFGRRPRTLSPAAVEALEAYRWPGNVRELKNLIERLMILCPAEEIRREDLPAEIRDAELSAPLPEDAPLRDARDDFERRYILAALRRHRGNVSHGRRGAAGREEQPVPEAEELRDRSRAGIARVTTPRAASSPAPAPRKIPPAASSAPPPGRAPPPASTRRSPTRRSRRRAGPPPTGRTRRRGGAVSSDSSSC